MSKSEERNGDYSNDRVERAVIGGVIGAAVGTIILPGIGTAKGAKIGAALGASTSEGGADPTDFA